MIFIKNIFKINLIDTDIFKGAVEMHCHLLPAVDDGIQELEKSVKTMNWLQQIGFEHIFLTPHIMNDWPKNNYNSLNKIFESFKSHVPKGMGIGLAAEYMLDPQFDDRVNEPILSFNNQHVLVETSYFAASPMMREQLYQLRLKEHIPILAHPERYTYLSASHLLNMHKEGILFQLNLMSLCGAYGPEAKEKAEFLLKNNAYNFVGTDTHSYHWLRNCMEKLKLSKKNVDKIRALFDNNRETLVESVEKKVIPAF